MNRMRLAFTRYMFWINTLSDMPRYFVVVWTLLMALLVLALAFVLVGLAVRALTGAS